MAFSHAKFENAHLHAAYVSYYSLDGLIDVIVLVRTSFARVRTNMIAAINSDS